MRTVLLRMDTSLPISRQFQWIDFINDRFRYLCIEASVRKVEAAMDGSGEMEIVCTKQCSERGKSEWE